MPYGYRLWIEGSAKQNGERLNDPLAICKFIERVIEAAGMTLAAGPMTYQEKQRDIGKGPGVTCVAILVESSIHIHTYPEQGYFFFELFSCSLFDKGKIEQMVMDFVECEVIHVSEFKSVGDNFPEGGRHGDQREVREDAAVRR